MQCRIPAPTRNGTRSLCDRADSPDPVDDRLAQVPDPPDDLDDRLDPAPVRPAHARDRADPVTLRDDQVTDSAGDLPIGSSDRSMSTRTRDSSPRSVPVWTRTVSLSPDPGPDRRDPEPSRLDQVDLGVEWLLIGARSEPASLESVHDRPDRRHFSPTSLHFSLTSQRFWPASRCFWSGPIHFRRRKASRSRTNGNGSVTVPRNRPPPSSLPGRSPTGGEIRLTAAGREDTVEVTVADNGCGIAASSRPRGRAESGEPLDGSPAASADRSRALASRFTATWRVRTRTIVASRFSMAGRAAFQSATSSMHASARSRSSDTSGPSGNSPSRLKRTFTASMTSAMPLTTAPERARSG